METISYFDFQDLRKLMAVRRIPGGDLIRGDDRLEIEDGEPVLAVGEEEVARLMAVTTVAGNFSEDDGDSLGFGVAMRAGSTVIVTSERLIVLALKGVSAQGQIHEDSETHTLVWPWDLTDQIHMSAKKRSPTESPAGERYAYSATP